MTGLVPKRTKEVTITASLETFSIVEIIIVGLDVALRGLPGKRVIRGK
jgi:hypothetical protein